MVESGRGFFEGLGFRVWDLGFGLAGWRKWRARFEI